MNPNHNESLEIYNTITKTYELFFSRVSGNREYLFTPTPSQKKQIENFTTSICRLVGENAIDEDFIFMFIAYQFSLRKDQKTRFGKGMVMLNHVIGKKALETWQHKPDSWGFHTTKFIKEKRIPRPVREQVKFNASNLSFGEENLKSQYVNTEVGLEVCVNNTTLYHPQSEVCSRCEIALECQGIQSELYPELHNKRKVGNGN